MSPTVEATRWAASSVSATPCPSVGLVCVIESPTPTSPVTTGPSSSTSAVHRLSSPAMMCTSPMPLAPSASHAPGAGKMPASGVEDDRVAQRRPGGVADRDRQRDTEDVVVAREHQADGEGRDRDVADPAGHARRVGAQLVPAGEVGDADVVVLHHRRPASGLDQPVAHRRAAPGDVEHQIGVDGPPTPHAPRSPAGSRRSGRTASPRRCPRGAARSWPRGKPPRTAPFPARSAASGW